MKKIKSLYNARFIVFSLVIQDLKRRYRNSVLGIGWSLLTPLGLVAIIGVVYSQIFGQSMSSFVPYLFSGIIPWLFIVQCAEQGTMAFLAAEGYIKQTRTPIEVFPVRVAFGAFVNLLLSLLAYIVVSMFILGAPITFNLVYLPLVLLVYLVFGVAIATLSGIINTYFRDYAPIQTLALQGFFYGTPIIFQVSLLRSGQFEWIYMYNPFYYLIELFRLPLISNPTSAHVVEVALIIVAVIFLVSAILLRIIGRKIAFKL